MTRDDAKRLVEAHLSKDAARYSQEFVVMDAHTLEEDFGWVFFYDSKQFVETGDIQYSLGGNSPLIVDRRTGELHVTGTALPLKHYLDEYRRAHP